MAEAKKGFADSLFNSVASGIAHIVEPKEKTLWHTVAHKWLSITEWVDYIRDWQISGGFFVICLYIPLFVVASLLVPEFVPLVFGWVLFSLPVTAPVGAAVGFWAIWIWYIQSNFVFRRVDPIVLEIRMPAKVQKSPRAMEHIFSNFWTRMNTTTFIDRNWFGGMTPYYSFEIASFGGDVRFFICARRIFKNSIESNFYAQYPGIEIVEVEDYASKFVYDENVECFATDYALTSNAVDEAVDPLEPDSAKVNAYPPKSYVDFELDQEPQTNRTDPFAQVIERMSAYNKEEQVWLQMIIRPYFGKKWKKVIEAEVAKIRDEASQQTFHDPETGEEVQKPAFPRPTWKQTEQIRIMERHLSKFPFEVAFRGIYIAPAGKMRGPEYTGMRWIWRPFANQNWMSTLRPRRAHNDFDYLWQDWNGVRYRLFSRRWIDAYRRRCAFNYPWLVPYHIFSTETLATLWHPPSENVMSPGLQRAPATKGQAPTNLPM